MPQSALAPEPDTASPPVPPVAPTTAGAADDEPEAPTAAAPPPAVPGALTAAERADLIARLDAGQPLPEAWRYRLFPASPRTVEIGKEYRLEHQGKMKREAVLADTPAAPWQLVRRFCTDRPFDDGWRNLPVWGDNLLALRELVADQRGPNRCGPRDRIKLVYIDPPFATRQDFMKDKEKAYRDKVLGAQFIEFLRWRLVLLREVLADDGTIYIHLDNRKGHYIKAVLDEVMGEENFQNQIAGVHGLAADGDPVRPVWKREEAGLREGGVPMSLQFRVADQVLRVDDGREATEALVHKYDAFLNLLCGQATPSSATRCGRPGGFWCRPLPTSLGAGGAFSGSTRGMNSLSLPSAMRPPAGRGDRRRRGPDESGAAIRWRGAI